MPSAMALATSLYQSTKSLTHEDKLSLEVANRASILRP